jgi:hypothetical protein
MKRINFNFQKNYKNYVLVIFIFFVVILFVRSIIVNPPASGGYARMKMMKSDMQQLLSKEGTVVLKRNEVRKSEAALLSILVRPEGWGTRPLPSDETLLNQMKWRKLSDVDNSFCKNKVKLTFTSATYENKNAIGIVMRFDNQTVADCDD